MLNAEPAKAKPLHACRHEPVPHGFCRLLIIFQSLSPSWAGNKARRVLAQRGGTREEDELIRGLLQTEHGGCSSQLPTNQPASERPGLPAHPVTKASFDALQEDVKVTPPVT
jgi:hypothetical protein